MIPGTIAAIAFLIFFGGHYLAGLAGWEVVAVFLVGVALVLSELLLHPGTMIPGVTGVMLMIGALLWAMIDRYPGQPFWPTAPMLYVPARKAWRCARGGDHRHHHARENVAAQHVLQPSGARLEQIRADLLFH